MHGIVGKVAVVTGASKGIGEAIAKYLAAAGAKVVVNYSSSRESAERVVAEIAAKDGKAVAVGADLSKPEDVKRLFNETQKVYGLLDVLVNNAGIYRFAPIDQVTVADFRAQFDINVLGTFLAVREALKHFGPAGGSVINVSSVAGRNSFPNAVLYAATKAAVESLTQGLARELAGRRIRVNAVAPGYIDTKTAKDATTRLGETGARLLAATPLGRSGHVEDVAPVVAFLASDEAAWITGETLRVSGGAQ
jgi:3-oxoacyl-[acyl-carrier protein] reductase